MLKNPEIEDLYELSLSKKSTETQANSIFKRILHEITEDEENSVSIIKCLKKGKNIDEEIAEEMKVGLNVVRRVLYKLNDVGLASYKRSKDPETQWYNYSWKFEENKLFEIIENKYNENSLKLKRILEYEEGNIFFVCENNECKCRYDFEEASENNFLCSDCGCKLEYQDNTSIIADLRKKIC